MNRPATSFYNRPSISRKRKWRNLSQAYQHPVRQLRSELPDHQARQHLRARFNGCRGGHYRCELCYRGNRGFVVCTNEGNADLGVSLPKIHIACMGIEKFLPRLEDLSVFTRLLARSATGQPITTYTSHFPRATTSCELHIVLVDNGRSRLRAKPDVSRVAAMYSLCACMNTCPVYRRSGGHSYSATVPGPNGSVSCRRPTIPSVITRCHTHVHCVVRARVCPVRFPNIISCWPGAVNWPNAS